MSMWHSNITRVFKYIIYNYRCSIKKDRLQYSNPLHRSKVAKVLLNSRCRTRNSSEIKYLLIVSFIGIFACNLGNEEKSSILRCGHFASSISNHLQQALQIKFGGQRNSNAVQLRQFFCSLLQI